MTKLTRDVVTDLWPLYSAREASADTRALVEAFLEEDPEFARGMSEARIDELLKPVAVALPADHEKATLMRTQRRRALQSMIVNGVALLGSAVLMVIYLWKVVPRWVVMFADLGIARPGATRFTILASNWTVRLLPFALAAVAIAYLFRKNIRLPEAVRSGTALAVVTAALLLLVQLGWLALLVESSSVLAAQYRAGMAGASTMRAMLAMRAGDYVGAIKQLQLARERLGKAGVDVQQPQALSAALLMGDAYLALGDFERADESYREALRQVGEMTPPMRLAEVAQFDRIVRNAIESLDKARADRR
jgi:hypothetical protein